MRTINAGIFHDSSGELLSLLGKKGTTTDIEFSNRKEGDIFYNMMQPREDKLTAKCQIMQIVDVAILCIDQITPAIGETILLLNSLKKKHGILILSDYVDAKMLENVTRETVVSGYKKSNNNFNDIMGALNSFEIKRDNDSKKVVEVDQFFNVKGVGTVILGFTKQGTLKKYDKLKMIPGGKEITIRSIQMHDKDFDEAPDGCRVGLALKGVDSEEFTKGTLLCEEDAAELAKEIFIEFEMSKFYSGDFEVGKVFHLSHGVQVVPVTIKSIKEKKIILETEKKIPLRHGQNALLLDLNAPKLHLVGSGKTL